MSKHGPEQAPPEDFKTDIANMKAIDEIASAALDEAERRGLRINDVKLLPGTIKSMIEDDLGRDLRKYRRKPAAAAVSAFEATITVNYDPATTTEEEMAAAVEEFKARLNSKAEKGKR